MASPDVFDPDVVLGRHALAGDAYAWSDLFRSHHPRLLRYIDRLLWARAGRAEDAEVVLARLWYALVADGGRRPGTFDPARADPGSLLAAVARKQLARLSGAARRPGRALAPLPSGDIASPPADVVSERALREEFVGRLTEAERRFYRERLLGRPDACACAPGGEGEELLHRIRAKFLHYLVGG
jgi:DNA-directed RNA polymerase specialized sigma24 family protein